MKTKRIYFRDVKGRFCKHSTHKKVMWFSDGERHERKGLSRKRAKEIQEKSFEIVEIVPKKAPLMKVAEKADNVIFTRLDTGKTIKKGYSGDVGIVFFKDGEIIGEFTQKGITKKDMDLLKPRFVREMQTVSESFNRKDGGYLWEAFRKKKAFKGINKWKKCRVIIKYKDGNLVISQLDLEDRHKTRKHKGKRQKVWSKQYLIAYNVKEKIIVNGMRFSGKNQLRSDTGRDLEYIGPITVTLERIE